MIKRLTKDLARATRLEDERGNALVELAFCLPLLMILAFGVIDFSQMIFDKQAMAGISRQGSDLASRTYNGDPTTLPSLVSGLVTQGASLNIGTNGRIILTVVADGIDSSGNLIKGDPIIEAQQLSSSGISVTSKVGSAIGGAATMPSGVTANVLDNGRTIYVTEVFYNYSPMTPVGNFLKKSLASTFYEAAYF